MCLKPSIALRGTRLLTCLRLFRPSPILPSLASHCVGLFAVVKSATDYSTLGIGTSLVVEDQHEWDEGRWVMRMLIHWRADRSSAVRHFDLSSARLNGDRWTIKTFIEIHLFSAEGLTKIFPYTFVCSRGGPADRIANLTFIPAWRRVIYIVTNRHT